MQKSKPILLALLVASIISAISMIGWLIIIKTAAQSVKAASNPPYKQVIMGKDVVRLLYLKDQATHAIHIYLDDTRHYSTTLNNRGLALEKLGNDTGAILYYKKALVIDPNNTGILDSIGMALNNLGNYTGAVEYYNRALAINPNDESALYNKGNALDHLGFPTF